MVILALGILVIILAVLLLLHEDPDTLQARLHIAARRLAGRPRFKGKPCN